MRPSRSPAPTHEPGKAEPSTRSSVPQPSTAGEAPRLLRRAVEMPAPVSAGDVRRLSRLIGNRAVGRALSAARSTQAAGMVQRDWASSEIRTALGGNAGHHIISKEDLSLLRSWAVRDRTANAQRFYTKFSNEKMLWNLGYNIVAGPEHYSNNPGTRADPSTVAQAIGGGDRTHLGLSGTEVTRYGITKRAASPIALKLRPIQALIDERSADPDDAAWSNGRWGTVMTAFETLEAEEDDSTPNALAAGEWMDDTSLAKQKVASDRVQLDAGRVKVDGAYVKVTDGVLSVNGEELELDAAVTREGDLLKVGNAYVNVNAKRELTVGGKLLKSWKDANYRKREGYVLETLAPDGEDSIFVAAARTNRDLGRVPSNTSLAIDEALSATDDTYQEDDANVQISVALDHVLTRHSFQWWSGESTNINVFFPPRMKDTDIQMWCGARARAFVKKYVTPALAAAKEAGDDVEVTKKGAVDGIYMDVKAEGTPDENEVWTLTVTFATMAMQAEGVQVTQQALRTFAADNAVPVDVE